MWSQELPDKKISWLSSCVLTLQRAWNPASVNCEHCAASKVLQIRQRKAIRQETYHKDLQMTPFYQKLSLKIRRAAYLQDHLNPVFHGPIYCLKTKLQMFHEQSCFCSCKILWKTVVNEVRLVNKYQKEINHVSIYIKVSELIWRGLKTPTLDFFWFLSRNFFS